MQWSSLCCLLAVFSRGGYKFMLLVHTCNSPKENAHSGKYLLRLNGCTSKIQKTVVLKPHCVDFQ